MTTPTPFLPRALAALLLCALARIAFAAAPATPAPATAAAAALPSEADCAAFGRAIAALLNDGKAAEAIQQLNKVALVNRISAGLGYSESEARDFQAGVLKTLPTSLQKQLETFTSARFLRVQTVAGERRALLRFVSEEGAVNYIALICDQRGTGPVHWTDAFMYMMGETISQSTRRTVLPLVAQSKKGMLEKLTGSDSAFVTHFATVNQASQLLQKGKFVEAWSACEKLPDSLKKDRTVLMLRLRLAQSIDDTKYLRVINDWQAAFPGDATLDFISIDGDILRKDYASALKHIDSFAQRIGGDAYLDFLGANVLIMAERYDDARARARAALAVEPTLASAFDALLTITLKTKNYAETVKVLEELRSVYPAINLDSIAADKEYAEFRLSRAYRDWSAQAKNPPEKSAP